MWFWGERFALVARSSAATGLHAMLQPSILPLTLFYIAANAFALHSWCAFLQLVWSSSPCTTFCLQCVWLRCLSRTGWVTKPKTALNILVNLNVWDFLCNTSMTFFFTRFRSSFNPPCGSQLWYDADTPRGGFEHHRSVTCAEDFGCYYGPGKCRSETATDWWSGFALGYRDIQWPLLSLSTCSILYWIFLQV